MFGVSIIVFVSLTLTDRNTMDRESIKRMSKSLKAYSKHKRLGRMSVEELKNLPKEVIIACAADQIAQVWQKLPEHLRNDKDIWQYSYCTEHFGNNKTNEDEFDGPPPKRLFCCYCNMSDVNIDVGKSNHDGSNQTVCNVNNNDDDDDNSKCYKLLFNCCCNQQ